MDIKFLEIVAAGIYNSDNYVKGRYESKNRRIKLFELEIPLEKGGVSYINDESHIITPGNRYLCKARAATAHKTAA